MTTTPSRYFRVAADLATLESTAPEAIPICEDVGRRLRPGDGVLLSDYDPDTETGIVRYLGVVTRAGGAPLCDWRQVHAEIRVDTKVGAWNWATKPGFVFAPAKIGDYGLDMLFADAFEDLELSAPMVRRERPRQPPRTRSDRLDPIEVVGTPTDAPGGGWLYVIKSAHGYKIGRTRRLADRLRLFAVKLPFFYTVELCVWFDDHVAAEATWHQRLATKRINGEWFDLEPADLDRIRSGEL